MLCFNNSIYFTEEFTRLKEEIPGALIDAHLNKGKREVENGDATQEKKTDSKTEESKEKKGNGEEYI